MTSPLSWRIASSVSNSASIYVPSGGALLDGSESDGTSKLTAPTTAMTSNWDALNGTFTNTAGTAPDGSGNASKLLESAVTDRHIIYTIGFAITAGATVTYSIYSKMITRRYLQMTAGPGGAAAIYAFFDLQAGSVTNSGTVSPDGTTVVSATNCQAAVNGFYKCTLTGKVDAGTTSPYLTLALSDVATYGAPLSAESPSYLGVITNGALFWRPKVV